MAQNQGHQTSRFMPALFLRCPRCGKGKIYEGLLKTKNRCDVCGFNISAHDAADGPAFFGITIVGTLTGLLAGVVEIKYAPPLYIHFLIWPPFILVATLVCLIWFKSLFITIQYIFKVGEYEKEMAHAKKERQTPRKKTTSKKIRRKNATRKKSRRR